MQPVNVDVRLDTETDSLNYRLKDATGSCVFRVEFGWDPDHQGALRFDGISAAQLRTGGPRQTIAATATKCRLPDREFVFSRGDPPLGQRELAVFARALTPEWLDRGAALVTVPVDDWRAGLATLIDLLDSEADTHADAPAHLY